MDRIKKALDKSRTRKRRELVQPAPLQSVDSEKHPFENIEYTQTRHIDVSQAVLAEKRLIAGNRTDPRATAFRMLRTQVLQTMRRRQVAGFSQPGNQYLARGQPDRVAG
jgi:hypothetical protein